MSAIMMKLAEHAYMSKEAISSGAITKAFASRMARIGKAKGPMQDLLKGRTYSQLGSMYMNAWRPQTRVHEPVLNALKNSIFTPFHRDGIKGRNFIVNKMTEAYNSGNPAAGAKLSRMLKWSR